MQNANQPGDHWMVIWIDTIPEYFNCLAEFEHFLFLHGPKDIYNTKKLQGNIRSVCGQHCLMYTIKCSGYSFQDYLNLFDDNVVLNDIKAC